MMKQLINEFNQENLWGITVEAVPIGGTSMLNEQMSAAIVEKRLPHIVLAPSDQITVWYEASAIAELDPYIAHLEWGLRETEKSEIPTVYWRGSQVADRQIGFPAFHTQTLLFYNQTWAKELGFSEAPRTPDDLKKQVCSAAKQNNQTNRVDYIGTGGWIADKDPQVILSWLLAFEANPFSGDNHLRYQFDTPASLRTFNFFRDLLDQGCAWISRNPSPYDYFARRQALIYSGTPQDFPAQLRAQQRAASQDEWLMLPYPALEKPVNLASTYSYAILRSTPVEQLAAWLFLRYMSQPERQTQLLLTSSTLGVNRRSQEAVAQYRQRYPMWQGLNLEFNIVLTPNASSWRIVRRVLEDAGWQAIQTYTKPADIPGILTALDQQVLELITKKP
jgi:ABC-type glycerol-3-phosphate transport system substrate-binding protein